MAHFNDRRMQLNLKPLLKRSPRSVNCELASPAQDNCRDCVQPAHVAYHPTFSPSTNLHGRVVACSISFLTIRDHASH
jgi:hypothetical protein